MRDLFAFFVEVFWSFRGHRFVANDNWWLTANNRRYAEIKGWDGPAKSVCPFFWIGVFREPLHRWTGKDDVATGLAAGLFIFLASIPVLTLFFQITTPVKLVNELIQTDATPIATLITSLILAIATFMVIVCIDSKTGTINLYLIKIRLGPRLGSILPIAAIVFGFVMNPKGTIIIYAGLGVALVIAVVIYLFATQYFCPTVFYKSGQEPQ